MSIFKCKICGGTLEINVGETVATCEYCGTKQTLPKLDDEKKAHLFERANHFRRNNDFDKAMSIYEQILNDDAEDAESYWSIVLCRYGIEYVEDPSAHKRVPTVNRAQFTSVFDDEDYKSAIKYADSYQKSIYEQEARTINEIQKGILAISGQEEPFDVFICYKETDNNGRRTQDSVLATELYNELTREGFKVFFSRITLEDKLGTAYEPYIFAALNSSKVMVVLGTRPEYFNAVWVKNEWSRYLALIKNGARKILVPAYRDMNPYDLPEEFSHLQAQDMTKLGFMQDLVRGIKKLVSADKSLIEKETVVVKSMASGNAFALVKRGFLALEDGEWEKADEFFEQALNQNAEDAQAYLGKLMVECKAKKRENLQECLKPFDENSNYKKIVRFADKDLKNILLDYLDVINSRNENAEIEKVYQSAKSISNDNPNSIFDQENAISLFESIVDWKDAKEQIEICKQRIEKARTEEEKQLEKIKLDTERKAELDKREKEKRKKKAKKYILILTPIILVTLTILLVGMSYNTNYFTDITAVSAAFNWSVGLKKDGTVIAVGDNDFGQCDVESWTDIIATSVGGIHTVGLKKDGTAVATGHNDFGQCNVEKWKDITAISAGTYHTVGLKNDGTVVAVGDNVDGQCNVSDWKDIIAISAGDSGTFGLKNDGTVLVAAQRSGLWNEYNISDDWKDIVAISAGDYHTVGLRKDGTVVAIGNNDSGECDVDTWTDIVAISAGNGLTIGLKKDGTVVVTGNDNYNQQKANNWTDIVEISASGHILGLKKDGTVVVVGSNWDGKCNVGRWKNPFWFVAGWN